MGKIIVVLIFLILFGIVVFGERGFTGNVVEENEREVVVIPIKAHIIRDSEEAYTSFRSEKNVIELVGEANRIWAQGGIYFSLEGIVESEVSFEAIPNAINGNVLELYNHENLDDKKINLFLVQSLNGLNGLALMNLDSVLVSDLTTVNDYRTTAHEFGHILGLRHVEGRENLMARGRNGELLSEEEIGNARIGAREIFD